MTISKLAAAFIEGYKGHEQGPQAPAYIVLHGTVSPTKPRGARETATYFQSASSGGLAHYIVDPGEIIATCPEEFACWHSGHNADSIGIELCDPQAGPGSRWADSPHLAEESLAAKLVADLCKRYSIPAVHVTPQQLADGARGVIDHNGVRLAWPGCTDHTDVGPDFPWAPFLSEVNRVLSDGKRVTIHTEARDTFHALSELGYGDKTHADDLWKLNPAVHDDKGHRLDRTHGLDTYLPAGQVFVFKDPTRKVTR